jgi:arabinose-5-phosphate isomerase
MDGRPDPAQDAAMIFPVHEPPPSLRGAERLGFARGVLRAEAAALEEVAQKMDTSFLRAVDLIYHGKGRVAITGTGKSADVGQKLAGTLNSTGTRAYILDATRAMHGDLGMVHGDDVALVLSHSGESEEIVRLLPALRAACSGLIALTGNARGTLARQADVGIVYGSVQEACPLGLAPSTSTTVMIALGDALAFTLLQMREFTLHDFARFHPAGALGRKFLKVDSVMRRGSDLRLADDMESVRQVFAYSRRRERRTGAVMLTDAEGKLCGLFTDSDLARLFEQRREDVLDRPIHEVRTARPLTVRLGSLLADAVELMSRRKISELPVLDDAGRPVGLLDITDLIGFLPVETNAEVEPSQRPRLGVA